MAGFKTHITASTAIGVGGALVAHFGFHVPLPMCVLAGGLCSVSGMLPDLDSDSGVPLRESIAFAAAAVPVMMVRRWERLGMPFETMILSGMLVYLVIRFGLAGLLKKYTVHRGMFHSIPAALIAAQVTFLVFDHEDITMRYLNAGAVLVGFMSHLILDEIWSVGVKRGRVYLKSSSGTAIKLWGDSIWANFTTYSKVAVLSYLVSQDPKWMSQFEHYPPNWREMIANQKLPIGNPLAPRASIPRDNSPTNRDAASRSPAPRYLPRSSQTSGSAPALQRQAATHSATTHHAPTYIVPDHSAPVYNAPGNSLPMNAEPAQQPWPYVQPQDNPFEERVLDGPRQLVPISTDDPNHGGFQRN